MSNQRHEENLVAKSVTTLRQEPSAYGAVSQGGKSSISKAVVEQLDQSLMASAEKEKKLQPSAAEP